MGREHHHRYRNLYNHMYVDLNDNVGNHICTYSLTSPSPALGSQSQRTRIASVGAEGTCTGVHQGEQVVEGCPLFRRLRPVRPPKNHITVKLA